MQLPTSEYSYTAELVDVTSAAPLETAGVQAVSVLAVAAEGTCRWWPSLAQEGNYTETEVDLGDLCNHVVAVTVSSESPMQRLFLSKSDLKMASCHSGWELRLVLRQGPAPAGESRCLWEAAVPGLGAGSGDAVWDWTAGVQPVRHPVSSRQRRGEWVFLSCLRHSEGGLCFTPVCCHSSTACCGWAGPVACIR